MLDYVATMIYPDGGMLEQSLNYNETDALRMRELQDVFAGETKTWSNPMQVRMQNFWRTVWALRDTTFIEPQIGNLGRASATEVWTSSTVRNNWISSQLAAQPGG